MQNQTHCRCGTALKPLWSSWFCPKCEGDTTPEVRAESRVRANEVQPKAPNYFRRGHYTVRIDRVKCGQSKSGRDFVAIDATVEETHLNGDGVWHDWHKPGEKVTQFLMAANRAFMPSMRGFIAALSDLIPDDVTPEMCAAVTEPDNPCAGAVLDVYNRLVTTTGGAEFTKVEWLKKGS